MVGAVRQERKIKWYVWVLVTLNFELVIMCSFFFWNPLPALDWSHGGGWGV